MLQEIGLTTLTEQLTTIVHQSANVYQAIRAMEDAVREARARFAQSGKVRDGLHLEVLRAVLELLQKPETDEPAAFSITGPVHVSGFTEAAEAAAEIIQRRRSQA